MTEKPKNTRLGSPCSPNWDHTWIDRVNDAEAEAGHPICGAHRRDGTPCTLDPNHKNGRCRFHGGFEGTGAQPGNKNARIHGLYQRSLMRCGPHCAMWKRCHLSGPDVAALPEQKRPTCPFEQLEYDEITHDMEERCKVAPIPERIKGHFIHALALAHVLVSRAVTASGVVPMEASPGSGKLATPILASLRYLKEARILRNQLPPIPDTVPG